MARLARVVAAGLPHHVTQRGNFRQGVFLCDEDRSTYLGLLKQYAERANFRLVGYCLMSNHVHLIVVPEREDSLAKALGPAHCRYAHWMHARQHCVGHLWQNRFFSTVLDEAHLVSAMRYVERNPVRAGLVADAAEYAWSSAAAHVTGQDAEGVLDVAYWAERFAPEDWRARLETQEEPAEVETLRDHTETGRPLGSKEFVAELGRRLRRLLEPRRVGRPRKVVEKEEAACRLRCLAEKSGKHVACHWCFVTGISVTGISLVSCHWYLSTVNNVPDFPGSGFVNPYGTRYLFGTDSMTAEPVRTCDPTKGLGKNQFINGSCFAYPTERGLNGPTRLPAIRGPWFFNSDLALFKNFRISDSKKFQFRFNAYNFMNHPLTSYPDGGDNALKLTHNYNENGAPVLANDRFGYADYKFGHRVIQLALKFYF